MNKELIGTAGRVEDRTIAMRTIHSFPRCMRTLQTILLKAAPASDVMTWDLDDLRKEIEDDESRARAAGENLGTKLDTQHYPKALAAEQGRGRMRRRDPNDPTWLARQTCRRSGLRCLTLPIQSWWNQRCTLGFSLLKHPTRSH